GPMLFGGYEHRAEHAGGLREVIALARLIRPHRDAIVDLGDVRRRIVLEEPSLGMDPQQRPRHGQGGPPAAAPRPERIGVDDEATHVGRPMIVTSSPAAPVPSSSTSIVITASAAKLVSDRDGCVPASSDVVSPASIVIRFVRIEAPPSLMSTTTLP